MFARSLFARAPVLLLSVFLGGCLSDKGVNEDSASEMEAAFTLDPPEAGLGTSARVAVRANQSRFRQDSTDVDFGEGVTVLSITVTDSWTTLVDIEIADDAETGLRDVILTMRAGEVTLTDAFRIVQSSFTVSPENGKIGETLEVQIEGKNTQWLSGRTWVSFGDDIDIMEFTVFSETVAVASLAIGSEAAPGARDVYTEDGPKIVTMHGAFVVDRVGVGATFDPSEAAQGTTVEFTIFGRATDFVQDVTELTFFDRGGETNDIVVDMITVLDAENLWGRMTLSNAATIGSRDVKITTATEGVLIADAFEVVGGNVNLEDVVVGLSFTVVRGIDNQDCSLVERVSASASFVIPLDPPCGSSPPPGDGPQPYDINGVFPVPPAGEEVDCPSPTTVSAGDFVWLESASNVVTLVKQVDPSTATVWYAGEGLTMADYVPNEIYDLHLQGDPDGLPEEIVPEVQPTVPADWHLLTPELCGNYTQSRSEDFNYTWSPAQTYPTAIFSSSISGTLVATGEGGFAGSIPWDDGVHTYTAGELSQLDVGPVYFTAYSFIEGRPFGLQESRYQENQAKSYIYLQAALVLE